jgi:hypothetical protein
MRRILDLLCLLILCSSQIAHPLLLTAETVPVHPVTDWQLKPSLIYDTLCLLNALSGDPYYLQYYQAEYEHFHSLFTPEEQVAFAQLKHVIKDEGRGIVSAKLTLFYSVVDDETLPEMIRTAHDSAVMEAGLKQTSYWSADSWQNYEAARPALEVALRALDRVGFPPTGRQMPGPESRSESRRSLPNSRNTTSFLSSRATLAFPFHRTRSLYICWPIQSLTESVLRDCVS